ncbi:aminoglycoside phosphotransferase [Desulfatibacillum aliphaticivorans]|uniref:Aminoglycoside phosphotransferase n=1 Tax=Desulfatibacillum aliphaticivorans TaxID=218208 RepID=B8FI96_DESAL|nr:sugar phosphate nucleotidyltransferase [Desulfatibacillum aliphaticivorans]ACL02663.1 aminoglycoside phosphotransferase [Desulfatibacillum aliphaticivorans]
MKALILAAGFGERLRPLTEKTPKPLIPIAGTPALLRMIRSLEAAGCTEIAVNTHHLADQIQDFVASHDFSIPVTCYHEPEILGTGGAIKNLEHIFCDAPFLVVNGDILTDLDLGELRRVHERAAVNGATLVVHDYPKFNNVLIAGDRIVSFLSETGTDYWAFTGIQVVDPAIFDFLKKGEFQSSIAAYSEMMAAGLRIGVWMPENLWWHDMGSFEGLARAALETGALQVFAKSQGVVYAKDLHVEELAGGGSARQWRRLTLNSQSIVSVDHGLAEGPDWNEADAYNAIGRHLHESGTPVPKILAYDRFAGLVFAEDLGDMSLEEAVGLQGIEKALPLYEQAVKNLARMSVRAYEGFDPAWTCQTEYYDEALILEKESRYFFEAFVNGYLKRQAKFKDYLPELQLLAKEAVEGAHPGFLHRDFQSRNIMIRDGQCFFIDFQGGRIGPAQYDLASLLIDPYAALPQAVQDRLIDRYLRELSQYRSVDRQAFIKRYQYCALHRNMQMLGAFAHLSQNMNKPGFEEYIPLALQNLKERINLFPQAPALQQLIKSLELPKTKKANC